MGDATMLPVSGSAPASGPSGVFISYRREDAQAQAFALRLELVKHFGVDNVFMDVADIAGGSEWQREIVERLESSEVVLAVIGPRWTSSLLDRSRRQALDQREDQVIYELKAAFRPGARTRVLPVLLDSATMPDKVQLPNGVERLASLNAVPLSFMRWEDDVARIIACVEQPVEEAPADTTSYASPDLDPDRATVAPRQHLATVAGWISAANSVIPFLGSEVYGSCDGTNPGTADAMAAPDDLVNSLAALLESNPQLRDGLGGDWADQLQRADLAAIAQYVLLTAGEPDLYAGVKSYLAQRCTPGPCHTTLASLPGRLKRSGHPSPYQLIVTASYDSALERAFDAAAEQYDLAVYLAHGDHKGAFLHVPHELQGPVGSTWLGLDGDGGVPGGEALVSDGRLLGIRITKASDYTGFPVSGDHLTRTVILKIHGAVDAAPGPSPWRDNFLITENDYIEYLSHGTVENLVPFQLLAKLRKDHVLFLGHRLRDWNFRVFLQRLWGERGLLAKSWAVSDHLDGLEREFWNGFNVSDCVEAPVDDYLRDLVDEISRQLGRRA